MATFSKYRVGFLGVLFLLTGCIGTNFNWDKVQQLNEGMTQEQVKALMGRPNGVTATATSRSGPGSTQTA